ncbi:M20 metallopeptidase family protein [Natranaerofaba carboxydovora]|uniref:M20 metallopeptidase family protein n=1 Tax=Natranaerofaba carboxydovora TaxID=2742683 RepID=UPI001F14884F|nr:M20 family metallopeptidase [Natranaerofaba carboxydovora]UMZ74838.1 putative hydrolase YxeP [Natranaerofaba carboxydovora]
MKNINEIIAKDNIWFEKSQKIKDEIINYRRSLHQIPELSFEEEKTSMEIKGYLDSMGIDYKDCADTGMVALIEGKNPGPVIAIRADMDGMPASEKTGHSYKSKHEDVMHSCGHDGHMAAVLGAAKLLVQNKDKWNGTVKLIFQPAEELVQGAKRMIKEGVLESPRPDYVLGFHIWQPLQTGEVGIKKEELMASTENFKIIIHGLESHGAMPHQGIDAISAAAEFIQGIHHILSRVISVEESYVLSFGKIEGGRKGNVLPSKVELDGTFRTFEEKTANLIKEKIYSLLDNKKDLYGINWEYILESSASPTYNDPSLTEYVLESMKKILPEDSIQFPYGPVFPSEDFSEYAKYVPAALFFLGAGGDEYKYPHHHPKFDFDERALIIATSIILQTIEDLTT